MTKVNIREALNQMDKDTDCKYDLVTLYESCNLTEEDKKDIAKSIADKEDADVIYDKLVDKYGDDLSFDDDNINDLKFLDMSKEAYLYGEDNHDFEDLESGDNSDVEESFGDDLIDSQYLDDTSDGHWSWDYDDDELANIYGGDTRYDYHPDGIEESQNTDLHEGSSIAEDTSDRTSTESKEIKGYLTVIERDGTVVNESATDPRYYKMVEYNYDGDDISNYLGHVRVRTNSDKVALRAAEKYAMSKHPEDNPGHFKIVDDNYTNVDVIDSDGDYLTTMKSVDESKSIKEALDKDLISVWLDEHEEAREDFINWVSEHPHLYNDLLRFCKVDEKSVIDKVKENRSKSIKEDTTNPTYSWMIVKMGGDGVHYYYNASENIFTSNIDEGTRYAEREAIEDDFNAVRDNNDNCYMRKIPDMPDWKPLKVFSTHIYNHYPFSGAIELMDKVDENGEGQKLKFTSRDKMNSKADELLDNGYISYTYKRSQDESLKESVSDKYPIDKLFDSYTIDYDEYRDRFSSFFFSLITKINKYLQKNHSTMTIETDDWNIYNDCEGITVYLSEMPEGPEKFFEVADLINSYLKTNLPNMFKTVRNKYMDKSVDIPFSASPIQAMISLNDYLDKRNIGESLKGSTYNDLRNLSKSEVVDLNESKSIKESFPRNIDLDQVVMQVANLVDDKVLGDNWIEIFPIRDARQSVSGESSVPLEITGPYDITKKATFRTRNGRVEVAFLNGSEAMCDNAESIARFIAGEFGLDLDGDTPLLKDIPNEQLKEEGLATDLVIESAGNNVTNKFIRSIVESQDIHEGTSLKRIARYNEFDNGNVLHNYEKMTSEEAEEKAKQASLDNPNDIYYVAYDDIMDSSSDLRWINGKSYNYSDVQIKGGKPYIKDASANESIEDNSIEDIDKFVAEVKEKFPGSEAIYDGDTHTIKITLDNIQKENLTEDSTEVDELETADQKISSANTSINSSKLPAIFRLVKFEPDTLNLDYGGGKFDNAAEYLAQQNVTNLVYDPYNRSTQHNAEVLQKVRENGGADTITISNVLNVIAEPEARLTVLRNAKKLVKPGGNVYITVYEGNKSGEGTETKSGYQLNKSTADYIDEIASVFSTVNRRGKLIIAS